MVNQRGQATLCSAPDTRQNTSDCFCLRTCPSLVVRVGRLWADSLKSFAGWERQVIAFLLFAPSAEYWVLSTKYSVRRTRGKQLSLYIENLLI